MLMNLRYDLENHTPIPYHLFHYPSFEVDFASANDECLHRAHGIRTSAVEDEVAE